MINGFHVSITFWLLVFLTFGNYSQIIPHFFWGLPLPGLCIFLALGFNTVKTFPWCSWTRWRNVLAFHWLLVYIFPLGGGSQWNHNSFYTHSTTSTKSVVGGWGGCYVSESSYCLLLKYPVADIQFTNSTQFQHFDHIWIVCFKTRNMKCTSLNVVCMCMDVDMMHIEKLCMGDVDLQYIAISWTYQ